MPKIPFTNALQKDWDELDKFKPYVIEEIHRLFSSQDSNNIEISRTKENKLDKLSRLELLEILKRLAKEERFFSLEERNFPKRQLKNPEKKYYGIIEDSEFITVIPNEDEPIYLRLFPNFSNWYDAYIIKKTSKLENLSLFNLEKICYLVHDIEEKFEINPDKQIIIKLTTSSIDEFPLLREKCSINSDIVPYRIEALEYLKDHNIISYYEIKHYEYGDSEVGMLLNVDEFIKFKAELKTIYLSKCNKLKPKITQKSKIELPPNTKWEDITIEFKDGHNVNIKIGDRTIPSDYKEMGFEDKRTRKPNMQWNLLIRLSENYGAISWQSYPEQRDTKRKLTEQAFGYEDDEDDTDKEKNKGFRYIKASNADKKRKQELAKTLKKYFGINDDPFCPYRQEGSYKIRINLIPD